jgi:hypothetical protein
MHACMHKLILLVLNGASHYGGAPSDREPAPVLVRAHAGVPREPVAEQHASPVGTRQQALWQCGWWPDRDKCPTATAAAPWQTATACDRGQIAILHLDIHARAEIRCWAYQLYVWLEWNGTEPSSCVDRLRHCTLPSRGRQLRTVLSNSIQWLYACKAQKKYGKTYSSMFGKLFFLEIQRCIGEN